MRCYVCKKEKQESDMYFDHTGIHKRCNACVRKEAKKKTKVIHDRRREFVSRFNRFVGVA